MRKPMTKEEFRATLPPKLNKLGQWMVDNYGKKPEIEILDMRAVLK